MVAGTLRTTRLGRRIRMDRTSLLAARFGMWVGDPAGHCSWLEWGPGWPVPAVWFAVPAAFAVQGLALAAPLAACCDFPCSVSLPRERPFVVGPRADVHHPVGQRWLP